MHFVQLCSVNDLQTVSLVKLTSLTINSIERERMFKLGIGCTISKVEFRRKVTDAVCQQRRWISSHDPHTISYQMLNENTPSINSKLTLSRLIKRTDKIAFIR